MKQVHTNDATQHSITTVSLFAQTNNPPGLNLIRTEDLKTDLYTLASAHFKGRSAGTIDELKALPGWLISSRLSV